MPLASQVHVNAPLTNVSTAYVQDQNNFIADKVFPVVPVLKKSDLYFVYNKNDYFRDEAQKRAAGTPSAGGDYDLTTASYVCARFSFHKDITDEEMANSDAALNPEDDAAEYVTGKLLLKREREFVATYMTTSVWGTDLTPSSLWSDYAASDPISDIENGKTTILQNTGYEANTLVLSYDTFKALKNHPLIVDRYKHTSADSITADMLAAVFDVERVLISKGVYASNEEGGTAAMAFISTKDALLCYVNRAPALRKPSAGYNFAWTGLAGAGAYGNAIKRFTGDYFKSIAVEVRIEGELYFDQKVVGSDLGYFFNNCVA